MESKKDKTFSHLYSVGSGGSGQLLRGDLYDHAELGEVIAEKIDPNKEQNYKNILNSFVDVSLGGTIGLGLTKDGEVYSWGEYNVNHEIVRLVSMPMRYLDRKSKLVLF